MLRKENVMAQQRPGAGGGQWREESMTAGEGERRHRKEETFAQALAPGYRLGDYRILKTIGQGGFGITYKASYPRKHDREAKGNGEGFVAIKELFPIDLVYRDDDGSVRPHEDDDHEYEEVFRNCRSRFRREGGLLMGRFKSSYIVKGFDVFPANNTLYLVMEYLDGYRLSAYQRRFGALGERDILDIAFPLMGAMEEIHGADCVHRDIAPDNMMITKEGFPVLIDFGAAKADFDRDISRMCGTKSRVWKPGYSPCEQIDSKGRIGPWSDIYAFGAVLHEMVTRKKPPDALKRIMAYGQGGACDPYMSLSRKSRYSNEFSAELLGAIDWALQFEPEDRPQSVGAWRSRFPSEKRRHVPVKRGAQGSDDGAVESGTQGGKTIWAAKPPAKSSFEEATTFFSDHTVGKLLLILGVGLVFLTLLVVFLRI